MFELGCEMLFYCIGWVIEGEKGNVVIEGYVDNVFVVIV